jgi:NAD(P)-dependent dehydrogenase (short-subunit alcohol dehydrogenase family)
MKLEGKVAIITGATAGIGRGIAQLFAKEGCKICAVGRNEERGAEAVNECKQAGSDAFFLNLNQPGSGTKQYTEVAWL